LNNGRLAIFCRRRSFIKGRASVLNDVNQELAANPFASIRSEFGQVEFRAGQIDEVSGKRAKNNRAMIAFRNK
jgi:hypothetical protein